MKLYVGLLIMFILFTSTVSAYDTSEYIGEFLNTKETCETIDIFSYKAYDPQWWSSSHFTETVPVFYQCCEENSCVTIIVDLKGKSLLKDPYYLELIDLNYIKYFMNIGNLTKTTFVSQGLDSCYYHGRDRLNQESLNMVADTAETIALTQKTKQAKQVVEVVRTARALEIVSPVSLADLGLSVVCNFNNKKIKQAIEKIAECNLYLSNIQNNYAETGYVYTLENCLDTARNNLQEYRDMGVAKVKNVVDTGLNIIDWIINFFKGLFENPANIDINKPLKKTEYQIAGDVYNEIKDKQVYLHNPYKSEIFEKYAKRILQKRDDYSNVKTSVDLVYSITKKNKPEVISAFISDIFNEPNYNISEANELYYYFTYKYKTCELLYEQVKYNSAIECMKVTEQGFKVSNEIFERENRIVRFFDWSSVFLILLIIIIIFFGVKWYLLR